jgi:hypothetical protein
MGFFSKNVVIENGENNLPSNISPESILSNQLSKEEIELLLSLIKQTTFKGEHIEVLYNLVLKLQNQYLSS